MKKQGLLYILALALLLGACSAPVPVSTPTPKPSATRPLPSATRAVTATRTLAPSATPRAFTKTTLASAVAARLVGVKAAGAGLSMLNLTLINLSDGDLVVDVTAGSMFLAGSTDVQDMVITRTQSVIVPARSEVVHQAQAACAAMSKKAPTSADKLSYSMGFNPALMRLLALPNFHEQPVRVRQFAVWTITNTPVSVNNYVGIGMAGLGSGPTADEMNQVRGLFLAAGIYVDQYCVLQNSSVCARSSFTGAAVSPDRKLMALAGSDSLLYFRDLQSGVLGAGLKTSLSQTSYLANRPVVFSPDGKALAVASFNAFQNQYSSTVDIFDVTSRQQTGKIQLVLRSISVLLYAPDGKSLLVAGNAPGAQLWDAAGKAVQRTLVGRAVDILGAVYSAAGDRLAVVGVDATKQRVLEMWDVTTGKLLWANNVQDYGTPLVFMDQGKTLLSKNTGLNKVTLWDSATGKLMQQISGAEMRMGGEGIAGQLAVLSPDGKMAAINDGGLRLVNLTTLKEQNYPGAMFVGADFAPDGGSVTLYTWHGVVSLPIGAW